MPDAASVELEAECDGDGDGDGVTRVRRVVGSADAEAVVVGSTREEEEKVDAEVGKSETCEVNEIVKVEETMIAEETTMAEEAAVVEEAAGDAEEASGHESVTEVAGVEVEEPV